MEISMYEKILIPLDGSELAELALPYAEALAGRLGSEVTLIHVRAPAEDPYHPMHQAYLQKMVEATKQDIKRFLDKSGKKKIKVDSAIVGSSILIGHPAEEIVDYAEKENIGLIVMATHGSSGIKRWALGSVADKVVRVSKCPVLLIRANIGVPRKVKLDNLLIPLDGSRESDTMIPSIAELAYKLKTKISLLHVVVEPYKVYTGSEGVVEVRYTEEEMKWQKNGAEEYLQKVATGLKDRGIATRCEVRVGAAAEEIIKLADETHADVVTMSTHGQSGFRRWEHGSIADKVLHAGNTPLLLVRPHHQ
jgi:nucleotide-binding universal stress UspA family protein